MDNNPYTSPQSDARAGDIRLTGCLRRISAWLAGVVSAFVAYWIGSASTGLEIMPAMVSLVIGLVVVLLTTGCGAIWRRTKKPKNEKAETKAEKGPKKDRHD